MPGGREATLVELASLIPNSTPNAMLPDFALHHLPLYGVTLFAAGGLALWVRVRWTLARQTATERREVIAEKALASSRRPLLDLDELATEMPPPARSLGRRQVR
ncbi:MAG: hypothetical protein Rubg2KO_14670 [Rubricoccaceae bacterium]